MNSRLYLHSTVSGQTESNPTASELEAAKERLIKFAEIHGTRYLENLRYINANFQDLLNQYPDQWVGVYEKRVIASDSTLKGMFDKVDQMGISRGYVAGAFMDTEPKPMIL